MLHPWHRAHPLPLTRGLHHRHVAAARAPAGLRDWCRPSARGERALAVPDEPLLLTLVSAMSAEALWSKHFLERKPRPGPNPRAGFLLAGSAALSGRAAYKSGAAERETRVTHPAKPCAT